MDPAIRALILRLIENIGEPDSLARALRECPDVRLNAQTIQKLNEIQQGKVASEAREGRLVRVSTSDREGTEGLLLITDARPSSRSRAAVVATDAGDTPGQLTLTVPPKYRGEVLPLVDLDACDRVEGLLPDTLDQPLTWVRPDVGLVREILARLFARFTGERLEDHFVLEPMGRELALRLSPAYTAGLNSYFLCLVPFWDLYSTLRTAFHEVGHALHWSPLDSPRRRFKSEVAAHFVQEFFWRKFGIEASAVPSVRRYYESFCGAVRKGTNPAADRLLLPFTPGQIAAEAGELLERRMLPSDRYAYGRRSFELHLRRHPEAKRFFEPGAQVTFKLSLVSRPG